MEKAKRVLKRTVKFAIVVCFVLVVGLVICGLPLEDIKKSLKSKLENK